MKKRIIITISCIFILICCVVSILYIRKSFTAYTSQQAILLDAGLSSEEASQLVEIGAVLNKLRAENLIITESEGRYQVVDEVGNAVKKTADLKASQINYILKKVQEYATAEPVSYEIMLQDIAAQIQANPDQSTYRVVYENGSWLEAEVYCENADANDKDEKNSGIKSSSNELTCINPAYPNEVKICSDKRSAEAPGRYEYTCELRLYTGLYYLQIYLKQIADFSENMNQVLIDNIQSGQASAGALEIVSGREYLQVDAAEKDSEVWCEAEAQTICRISDVLRVPLADPFSTTAVERHTWTHSIVFRTVPEEMRMYGAYYGIMDSSEEPISNNEATEETEVEVITESSDSTNRIPYTIENITEKRYEKNGSYIEFQDFPENDAETIACLKLLYSILEENWHACGYEYYDVSEKYIENSADADIEISNTLYEWIKVDQVNTMSLEDLKACRLYDEFFVILKNRLYDGDYDDYVQMLYENGCVVVNLKYTDKYKEGHETLQTSDGEHDQYWLFVPDENDQLRAFSYTDIYYQFAFGHSYKVPDDEVPAALKKVLVSERNELLSYEPLSVDLEGLRLQIIYHFMLPTALKQRM